MMPVNYGHSEDGLNLTLVFSSWIGPMLDLVALQQPKGIKTNMAQGLCREIMQGR